LILFRISTNFIRSGVFRISSPPASRSDEAGGFISVNSYALVTLTTVSIQRCWPLIGSGELGMIQFGWTP
jgi:hypothetical protein